MKDLLVFGMGFASGWAARMHVDSMREAAVGLIAAGLEGADRARLQLAAEQEFLQDLWAEGRARYEARRDSIATPEDPDEAATSERVRAA